MIKNKNYQKGNALIVIVSISVFMMAAAIVSGWAVYSWSKTAGNQTAISGGGYSNPKQKPAVAPETKNQSSESQGEAEQIALPIEFKEYAPAQDPSAAVNAFNQFAFEFYRQTKNSEKNLFFSPYSLAAALQMVYEGSRGQTAQEIRSVFHFSQNNEQRLGAFLNLYGKINPQNSPYQLSSANGLWTQTDCPFDQNYIKTIQTYFKSEAQNLDFANDAEGSRQKINQWVGDKTAQKIPELFGAGAIQPLTRLVLANAVYFKGKWLAPFEKSATSEKDFQTLSGQKIKCRMMRRLDDFKYAETAAYQALELPYENKDLSMIVILPKFEKTNSFENDLAITKFIEIKNSLRQELVDASLPRLKFNDSYDLKQTLAEMGMPSAFDPMAADFSGMTGKRDLYIGAAIHKSYLDIDEEGTEAAAATGIAMANTAAPAETPKPKIFNADHPFIFAIIHNQTGAILFLGKANDPGQ